MAGRTRGERSCGSLQGRQGTDRPDDLRLSSSLVRPGPAWVTTTVLRPSDFDILQQIQVLGERGVGVLRQE